MPSQSNVIPLGVSGLVTVPESAVPATKRRDSNIFLYSDDERQKWLVARLARQLDHPLIAPGSESVTRQVLARFPVSPLPGFADKLIQTLRDGESHSTLAVPGIDRPIAVCFVSWRGSWSDAAAVRYGDYLPGFFAWIKKVNDWGLPVTGYLQIDAFVDEQVDAGDPLRKLEAAIALDVEYSFLPGFFFGPPHEDDGVPKMIFLNGDLLSAEQRQDLAQLIDH